MSDLTPTFEEGGFFMLRPLIQALQLTKAYGYHEIFRNIEFLIREGEKIGLVGPNGVGKTTLLRLIAGLEAPTSGSFARYRENLVIGFVAQDPEFALGDTPEKILTAEQNRLGLAAAAGAEEALSRFGLSRERSLPVAQLSGGQKTRLGLAKAWLSRPDLLLLDEPTNHLDQKGLRWLERFVREYPGTVLVVSHDRYFLDQVVTRILELSTEKVEEYSGNYTDYRKAKEAAYAAQLARYQSEQKEIRRIDEAIQRQLQWAEKAHRDSRKQSEVRMGAKEYHRAKAKGMMRRVKSTVKRLESMKEASVPKPKEEQSISLARFNEAGAGRRLILAEDLSKAFDKPLFSGGAFSVFRGDKVGIVGPNGAGKTTLVRMILGQEPVSGGELWVSPGARIGYLDQELAGLNESHTVLEATLAAFPRQTAEVVTQVRTLLDGFLFSTDDVAKPVAVLSTGERKRIALIRLLVSDFNLLILDEPTDHLDLPSREKLEEALVAYGGTLLLVSHDRYLLQRVCTKILAIENGTITSFHGGFEEYYNAKQVQDQKEKPAQSSEKLSKEEKLLLQNRLAEINSRLSFMAKDDPEYQELEAEFFAVSERLRVRPE